MAPIAVGDSIPDGKLFHHDEYDQLVEVSIHSLAAGKKVVLFGIPGCFTPTCRYVFVYMNMFSQKIKNMMAFFQNLFGIPVKKVSKYLLIIIMIYK